MREIRGFLGGLEEEERRNLGTGEGRLGWDSCYPTPLPPPLPPVHSPRPSPQARGKLPLTPMPLALADFVHRWKAFAQTENAGAQSHFLDLCDLLGQPHPAAADSAGENYAFQKHVGKARGGKGFADVWLRDHFAWEYKAPDKNLAKAYAQLNDYREELGNPPLLVVCDLDRFEVHTNFTATSKRVYAFNLDELNRNQVTATCRFESFLPLAHTCVSRQWICANSRPDKLRSLYS